MISVEEAKEIILKNTEPLNTISLMDCASALGYVLSEDIISPIDLPSFNQSAVDGYGINISQGLERNEWTVIDEIKAGDFKNPVLKKNSAVRIFTGAAVPEAANCVIMQENLLIQESTIKLKGFVPKANDNIRYKKSQIEQGEIALKKDTRLNPAAIGFLNGLGINQVAVKSFPKIQVIITGTEVQKPGTVLTDGKVFDSNSGIIKSVLAGMKIPVIKTYIVEDKIDELAKAIKSGLEESDILILSGGISVGRYDLVKEALEEQGVHSLFHKIAQKPGKPLYFGKVKQKIVFALPGNPAAVLTCFYEYLYPAIRKMHGYDNCFLNKSEMLLLKDIPKRKELSSFLKAKITASGILPLEGQESNILRSFSEADALIYIPQGIDKVEKGRKVEVHILPEY